MADTPIDGGPMADELDEKLLTRYLTGSCSEDEKVRVEDRVFADDAAFDRLRAVEEELIERYNRGELGATERAQFEAAYSSQPRRQRVLFAESLNQLLSSEESRPVPEAKPSFWETVRASFQFKVAFAAAAALLLAAAVVWRSDRTQPPSSTARIDPATEAVPRQPDAEPPRVQEPEKRDPEGSPSLVATFVLSPGLVRSGQGAASFVLAPTIASVRAQLELEPDVEYPSYRVELRDSAARVIWSENGRRATTESTVTVTIPASNFDTGEYEIVLFGEAGASREDAGRYYFDVIKK